jgi:CheY-like chemotaxis protein
MLSVILSPSFQCRTATSRDEALTSIKSGEVPSCILMDFRMPGMALETFLDEVKAHKIKIVLMTGDSEVLPMSHKSEVADSLRKPILPDVLLRTASPEMAFNALRGFYCRRYENILCGMDVQRLSGR